MALMAHHDRLELFLHMLMLMELVYTFSLEVACLSVIFLGLLGTTNKVGTAQ